MTKMNDVAVTELSRAECLALLATSDLGQLALTRRALPKVVPAHYVVRDDHVVVHISTGLDKTPWVDGEVVSLHVFAFADDQRYGWSVSVTGAAHGTPAMSGDEQTPHAPWIAHGGGDIIAISTDLLSGERLVSTHEPTPHNQLRPGQPAP